MSALLAQEVQVPLEEPETAPRAGAEAAGLGRPLWVQVHVMVLNVMLLRCGLCLE